MPDGHYIGAWPFAAQNARHSRCAKVARANRRPRHRYVRCRLDLNCHACVPLWIARTLNSGVYDQGADHNVCILTAFPCHNDDADLPASSDAFVTGITRPYCPIIDWDVLRASAHVWCGILSHSSFKDPDVLLLSK